MIWSRANVKYGVFFFICTIALAGSGCRFPWPHHSTDNGQATDTDNGQAVPAQRLSKHYRSALKAYQSEDYDTAAKRFEAARKQAKGGDLARNAGFGLACSRLMAAETPKEYHEAVAIWEAWVEKAPSNYEIENPKLMAPLVEEKMLFSNIPLTPDGKGDIEAGPKVSQWLVINASKEIKRLRGKLETMDRSNHKLKGRIGALEKQMAKLQRKIKALEAIDQKIQEKKSAIPSTEPIAPR